MVHLRVMACDGLFSILSYFSVAPAHFPRLHRIILHTGDVLGATNGNGMWQVIAIV